MPNAFKDKVQKERQEQGKGKPDEQQPELKDVCPYLTTPVLIMQEVPVFQRMPGQPPAVPQLAAGYMVCIAKGCKFWSEKHSDCSIKLSNLATIEMAESKRIAT